MSFLQVSKTALLNCLNSLNLRQQQQSREVNQRLPSFAGQNNNQQQQLSVKHDLRVLCASVCFCVLLATANNNKTTTTRAATRPHARACAQLFPVNITHTFRLAGLLNSKSVTAFVKGETHYAARPHMSAHALRGALPTSAASWEQHQQKQQQQQQQQHATQPRPSYA